MTTRLTLLALSVCLCGFLSPAANAAVVQYSGQVFLGGIPVSGGYIVAGTFEPGFDPYNGGEYGGTRYNCVYGDELCNLNPGAYDAAVSDGNFIPIGSGALTNHNGEFSASGSTNASEGKPIWLFAFEDKSRDSLFQVLASSSDPNWRTPSQPAGIAVLDARDADLFVFGFSHPRGVALDVVPFPEPSSLALLMLGGPAVIGRRCCQI